MAGARCRSGTFRPLSLTRCAALALLLWAPACTAPAGGGQPAASSPALTPRQRAYFQRMARQAEPGGRGRAERLAEYLAFFRREMINDPRLFVFQVRAAWTRSGQLRLAGIVEFAENRTALVRFFDELGFDDIQNAVETVPTAAVGTRRFGVIQRRHSLVRAGPSDADEVVTDCLLGELLYLLDGPVAGHVLCHTGEGYTGYVPAADVRRFDAEAFAAYQRGPTVCVTRDVAVSAELTVPLGARLPGVARTETLLTVRLPAGNEVAVAADNGVWFDGEPPPAVRQVLARAKQFLGTPYLWGGKTAEGVDCSGLVQTAFAAQGIHLPRDSNQQVLVGRLTGSRWFPTAMRPGDTLYFLGFHGKISHTAIYLGQGKYLEAVRPVVRITEFDWPSAEDGRSGSFAFAKRLLE